MTDDSANGERRKQLEGCALALDQDTGAGAFLKL